MRKEKVSHLRIFTLAIKKCKIKISCCDYDDNESTFTTEGESDFYSSRRSSINSESDFARSPQDKRDTFDSTLSSLNAEAQSNKTECTETECTSHVSSTVDSSDTDEDKE